MTTGMLTTGMLKEAKIVVGLNFGTTFSGFAYALRADPDTVYTFYDWPMQAASGGIPYCKTQTSLLYADGKDTTSNPYELRDWGWPAFIKYKCVGANPSRGASGSDRKRKPSKYVLKEEVDEDFQVIHNVNSSALERAASKQAGCESSSGTEYCARTSLQLLEPKSPQQRPLRFQLDLRWFSCRGTAGTAVVQLDFRRVFRCTSDFTKVCLNSQPQDILTFDPRSVCHTLVVKRK